ncbi:MAG: hypothetical protein ACYTGH_16035 [Planctomycetota bacterium]|jgi:sialate O-acetylesterase
MKAGLTIRRASILITTIFAIAIGSALQAAPKLPGFFTKNMVLQRNKPVPVWGWAEAGETVTVNFAGQEASATTDDRGSWKVILKAMPASNEGQVLTIKSDRSEKPIQLNNIVVGDVWICSGQSNMEWVVGGALNPNEEAKAANTPLIRHMKIGHQVANTPQQDVKSAWVVCSPETVAAPVAVRYAFRMNPVGCNLYNREGLPASPFRTDNWR